MENILMEELGMEVVFKNPKQIKSKPQREFPENFRFQNHLKGLDNNVYGTSRALEFIGTGDFGTQWFERQQYEVDAGRDMEPILYTPLYNNVVDPNLPESIIIYYAGPFGVVFEEVTEGEEVKMATVTESNVTLTIKNYAVMIEYTEDMFVYNRVWDIPLFERQAGIAYNALLNHMHFKPFLEATYGAANQTAAASGGDTLSENMILTLEDAVASAATDGDNPRRGPYAILTSSADWFKISRALRTVPQQGFDLSSPVVNQIRNVIVYDGWTGVRGKKSVTYPGVTAGKAYLIDVNPANQMRYARSMFKQTLTRAMGNPDISRFIADQVRYNTRFGLYCNPLAITEEITLPTS